MNEGYSDEETLELQEEDQSNNQRWSANTSSERIRRSCASTDIAALMDTEMDEDSGREEVEEHCELPQKWIDYYREKFHASITNSNRWQPPAVLEDRFRELLNRAVLMCETGHADGTVDTFIDQNLNPLFRKWYYSGDAVDHWPVEIFFDIGETIFRVVRMLRGLMVAGAGSRDIFSGLWELFMHLIAEYNRTNGLVGERLYQMNLEVDESADVDLVKQEFINANAPLQKYGRMLVLVYDSVGFTATAKFFNDNITTSTSIEELLKYLKSFKLFALAMNSERAFETFASIVFTGMDRLANASEEELSCKNLRGPLESHPLYNLYQYLGTYVHAISELQKDNHNMLTLFRWRLKFILKALNEAPFNGRMSAVECLTILVNEFPSAFGGLQHYGILMKWLEEERAVDFLTKDNLHNINYVDRVLRTFDVMLRAGIFTTADLSTVWEAQRGKHDVIQRNLADLIIRIVPHFDNDLLEALFHKIEAGWIEGGVKERATLIEIVRKIGEQSAYNIAANRPTELDNALINNSLTTLWKFIRSPGDSRENEEPALQSHLKLLDMSRNMPNFVKMYAELCSADIQNQSERSATAASHLVHILELVVCDEDDDDEEEDVYERGNLSAAARYRVELIGSLETSHNLVQSLCANIAKCVLRTDDTADRRAALDAFVTALSFALARNSDLRLSEANASELWEALVSNPTHKHDMRRGYKFFMDLVDHDVLDRPIFERFFKNYVLALPPAELTSDGYMCFESFFKMVNDIEHAGSSYFLSPDDMLGSEYVRELILQGQAAVCQRAGNLWVDNLQKIIYKSGEANRAPRLLQSLVDLIMEQYESMAVTMREAAARGLSPTQNPAYEMTKERTMRCIKLLTDLVSTMDDEVGLSRRSLPALGRGAIGRPIFVNCKVPRREWDSVSYKIRGDTRADDLDNCLDLHENTTVAELRDMLRRQLADRLLGSSRSRKKSEVDEVLEQFLLVHVSHEGAKTLHYADYKRTLGEIGAADVVELEIRLKRAGEASPDTSTSDGDWMSPEDMVDDRERESYLTSRALAADEGMIDRLLQVAESSDVDVAMSAFRLLSMVPQNEAKLAQLQEAMRDEAKLQQLLQEASDPRFLYYILMLEAIILPADCNIRGDASAINAMMMFIRVLPEVATLHKLMKRQIAFRSLAIISITHILHLACMTATRVLIATHWSSNAPMASLVGTIIRLSHVNLPVKWSKHIRVRRLSSCYADHLHLMNGHGVELVRLIERQSLLLLSMLCGVVLAATSFASTSPLAEDGAAVLANLIAAPLPMLDEATMERDPCTVPALLECAVYAAALLAAACPKECAKFIGAVSEGPESVWTHTLLSAIFHKADNVRVMTFSLTISTVEVVRTSLMVMGQVSMELRSPVGLTGNVLDLLPHCEGAEKYADQFVLLVKECVNRTLSWNAHILRLDEHIQQGVKFLDDALLHSTAQQSPFPDETYLKARIEVLQMLMRYTMPADREALGSAEGGPRLCERLLADFIFPAARVEAAAAAAAAGDCVISEMDPLPRSVTHMEMNSSSSLFELAGRGEGGLPRSVSALPISTRRVAVCSGEGSQEGVFNLLLALCDGVPANQVLMQTTMHRLFYSSPWTDKKDFDYLPQHVLRGEGELVGLKNGGATCYMNSIFQQLFMIDEVREAVLNAVIPEKVLHELQRRSSDSSEQGAAPDRGDYSVRVLATVQSVFAHLLGSELESYRPAEFWKVFAFKPNGESVNVREQQDAVEFHNMLTDLIDEGLKRCGAEPVCEKTFRGVFADEKICKDCPHRFTKEEPFESLSLDVRSHNNLRDSLKEYVKGDVLENDNAYHCEICNKKVKAIKRLSLSKLPEVLIVQLKRFDFDWEKEISVKFNDYFEFPFEMDIQPYTVDGLEKTEKGESLDNNRDQQYMLRGVVVHSGQAQGGHYTSYIRNRETGKWSKFDDNDVTPWDATESGAQQRWFGCTDNGQDSMGRGRRKVRTTYWNAYMLFYEKLETANRYISVNPSSVGSDMSTSSGVSSMTTTQPAMLTSSSAVSPSGGTSSPTPAPATVTASANGTTTTTMTTAGAVSPTQQAKSRSGKSISPVSHLHRHFSSMSLSSARIRMPPRLEEMLREGNRLVQLERVQYSTHFFFFVSSATGKALTTAELVPECREALLLATMKSFASFVVHNGLFASRDLMSEDDMHKVSFKSWQSYMARLLQSPTARLWFITHVLFSHEIAACFLFASDVAVREFFQTVIMDTMELVEDRGDASQDCLKPAVASPMAAQLAQAVRLFPRLSHLLANLLGMLPFKHNAAFRAEPLTFYATIIRLARKAPMLVAMVRGGILNNLLALFSPAHSHTDLSSLQRRDGHVYEELHRVVANGLRTIRIDVGNAKENPWCDPGIAIHAKQLPDFKVLLDFLSKDGGHVKFIQHLVDLLRRANRSTADLAWAVRAILFLCHGSRHASFVVLDTVCQSMSAMLSETAMEWQLLLLNDFFAIEDAWAEARYEHLFYNVQLTSTHAQPSVQGLLEYSNVQESRHEPLVRVLVSALKNLPGIAIFIELDERVMQLLASLNTFAYVKSASSKACLEFIDWYQGFLDATSASRSSDELTADEISDSFGESMMDDESKVERGPERPTAHSNTFHMIQASSSPYSPGQLSPSSRLGAMTLTPGEKRPLPPTEEDEEADGYGIADRKRSLGEAEMKKQMEWPAPPAPTPGKGHQEWSAGTTSSPMDDSELLLSSSTPSTSKAAFPAVPPPAYTELMAAGAGGATMMMGGAAGGAGAVKAAPASPLSPPPIPPRPKALAAAAINNSAVAAALAAARAEDEAAAAAAAAANKSAVPAALAAAREEDEAKIDGDEFVEKHKAE